MDRLNTSFAQATDWRAPPAGATQIGTVMINGRQRPIYVQITSRGVDKTAHFSTNLTDQTSALFQAVINKHGFRDAPTSTLATREVVAASDDGLEISTGNLINEFQSHADAGATVEWNVFKQHVLGIAPSSASGETPQRGSDTSGRVEEEEEEEEFGFGSSGTRSSEHRTPVRELHSPTLDSERPLSPPPLVITLSADGTRQTPLSAPPPLHTPTTQRAKRKSSEAHVGKSSAETANADAETRARRLKERAKRSRQTLQTLESMRKPDKARTPSPPQTPLAELRETEIRRVDLRDSKSLETDLLTAPPTRHQASFNVLDAVGLTEVN